MVTFKWKIRNRFSGLETGKSLPYIQGISESVARRLYLYYVKIAHKPHSALRSNLVRAKYPVPTLKRRKPWYHMSMIILGGIRETEELPTQ